LRTPLLRKHSGGTDVGMIGGVRTALTTLALVALAVVTSRLIAAESIFDGADGLPLLGWTAVAWALFAVAWWSQRRLPRRRAAALVVVGTLAIGIAAMAGPPNTSTDSARYAWDGIVSDAGISPYAQPPASDTLDGVREPWLFPPATAAADGTARCVGSRVVTTRSVPDGDLLCTTLNRPSVPTIYPPVAQGWFALVRGAVPPSATWWPMQLAGLVLVVAITLMVMRLLSRRGLDPCRAAWWGWCPFVASEAVTNSHIDALGVALVVGATLAAGALVVVPGRARPGSRSRRPVLVGVLLGLAAAVKFVPGTAALPLVRLSPVKVVTAAAVTFVVVYVPFVLVSGGAVLGYLPGYLREQGYESGDGFTLANLVVPGPAASAVSVVALVVVAVAQWRLADPDDPWTAQLVGAGAMLLVLSSPYPWYALVLVPFIALTGRWEWFVVPVVMTAHLLVPDVAVMRGVVPLAVVVVVAGWLLRRRARTPHAVAHEEVRA